MRHAGDFFLDQEKASPAPKPPSCGGVPSEGTGEHDGAHRQHDQQDADRFLNAAQEMDVVVPGGAAGSGGGRGTGGGHGPRDPKLLRFPKK